MVIVFDLDDTLYDEIDFVRSGFRAVARHVDATRADELCGFMNARFDAAGSGRVFDDTITHFGLASSVAELVACYRGHVPDIAIPDTRAAVLARLAAPAVGRSRFAFGLVSDGPHVTQRNKFERLGLGDLIARPVFTAELGAPKPSKTPFGAVMVQHPAQRDFVYIADNPRKDFIAPRALGWKTIHFRNPRGIYRHVQSDAATRADVEIDAFVDVLDLVAA